MSTKTITITEEAYGRLKSRKGENQSFSEVIVQNRPAKRKLSEILAEIDTDDELGDRIDVASKEIRRSKMRDVEGDDSNRHVRPNRCTSQDGNRLESMKV